LCGLNCKIGGDLGDQGVSGMQGEGGPHWGQLQLPPDDRSRGGQRKEIGVGGKVRGFFGKGRRRRGVRGTAKEENASSIQNSSKPLGQKGIKGDSEKKMEGRQGWKGH